MKSKSIICSVAAIGLSMALTGCQVTRSDVGTGVGAAAGAGIGYAAGRGGGAVAGAVIGGLVGKKLSEQPRRGHYRHRH